MAKVLNNKQQQSSLSCDLQVPSRTPAIYFPTLGIQEIPASFDTKFFKLASDKQKELGSLICFQVVPPSTNPKRIPITDSACIFASEGVAFLEGSRAVCTDNKESLATLLDLADERGCNTIVVCIDRSNEAWTAIGKSFSEIGFKVLRPDALSLGDYFLMVMEI